MKIKSYSEFESKEDFLFYLFNELGYDELCLCYNYKDKDDELQFSRWVKYKDLMNLNPDEYIPCFPIKITRKKFIEKVTHRSILDIEVLFDIDYCEVMLDTIPYTFPTIKDKAIWVIENLKKQRYQPVTYFTGSKSYHISVLLPLRELNPFHRIQIKQKLLYKYGADTQKASDRCLISMEGSKHYKSGKIKEEVKLLENEEVKQCQQQQTKHKEGKAFSLPKMSLLYDLW